MSKFRVGQVVITTFTPTLSLEGVVVDGPHHHNWPGEDNYTVDVPRAGREYVVRESELVGLDEIRAAIFG